MLHTWTLEKLGFWEEEQNRLVLLYLRWFDDIGRRQGCCQAEQERIAQPHV